MIQKFKRGLAVTLAAMMTVSSYAPAVSAEGTVGVFEEINGTMKYVVYESQEGGGAQPTYYEVDTVTTQARCTTDGSIVYTAIGVPGQVPTKVETIPQTGHNPAAPEADESTRKPATCTDAEYYEMVVKCQNANCDAENGELERYAATETAPATGHTPGEAVPENVKDATCTEAGSYDLVVRCTVCGDVIESTPHTEEALGHDYLYDGGKPATCTENGFQYGTCQRDGCEVRDRIEFEALGHEDTGEWITDTAEGTYKEATCTEDGFHEEYKLCGRCSEEIARETVVDKATGHSFSNQKGDILRPATCTEAGYGYLECDNGCGTKEEREIPATGHTEKEAITEVTPATCTEAGLEHVVVTCEVCGDTLDEYDQETALAEHEPADPAEEIVKEPTCADAGTAVMVTYCKNCDKELERGEEYPVAPTGAHIAGEPVEANRVEADCSTMTDGSYDELVYCENCGTLMEDECNYDVVIPAEHKWDTKAVEEPVCGGADGYGYQTCSVCGEKNRDPNRPDGTVVLQAPPHTWSDRVVDEDTVVDSTCAVEGSQETYVYCTNCDAEQEGSRQTEMIPLKEHTWGDVREETVAPTCENEGYGYSRCVNCEAVNTMTPIPAKGHTWKKVTENSTFTDCETASQYDEVNQCTVCQKYDEATRLTYDVDPAEHQYSADYADDTWSEGTSASGILVFRCTKEGCNHRYNQLFTVSNYTEIPGKEATCTETGWGYYEEAIVCDKDETVIVTVKSEEKQIVPAKGHRYGADIRVENLNKPTETEPGSFDQVRECLSCGEEERTTIEIPSMEGMTEGKELEIVETIRPTCKKEGAYNRVIYNVDENGTKTELYNDWVAIPVNENAHVAGTPVMENEKEPGSCQECYTYEEAVYCTECGYEVARAKKELPEEIGPHTEEVVPAVAATCTKTGLTEGIKCSVCDHPVKEQETVPMAAHTPETMEAVAATCTTAGLTTGVKCSVCDAELIKQETVPATGHKAEALPAVEATCTATGLTAGEKCAVCGEILKAQTTVAKKAHTAGAAVKEYIKNASYTAAGSYDEVVYCSVCKTEMSRTAKAIPQLEKKGQTIKVDKKTKKKELKAKKAAKSKNTFRISATAASGKVTYEKLSGNKKITVKSNGKVIVAKGLKKGTYRVKVRLTAPGTDEFIKTSKKITIKVVVK